MQSPKIAYLGLKVSEKLTTNSFIKEVTALKKKYNTPEGLLFSPDRLEITVKRVGNNKHSLYYREFFDYLPDYACDFVIPLTIQALVQMGIPKEQIKRIVPNGVSLELEGDISGITVAILSELMIQKKWSEEEISKAFDVCRDTTNNLTSMSKLVFEWSDQNLQEFLLISEKILEVTQNPSFISDMKALNEKYSKTFEDLRAKMSKPKVEEAL